MTLAFQCWYLFANNEPFTVYGPEWGGVSSWLAGSCSSSQPSAFLSGANSRVHRTRCFKDKTKDFHNKNNTIARHCTRCICDKRTADT